MYTIRANYCSSRGFPESQHCYLYIFALGVTLWLSCVAPCKEAPVYLEQNSKRPGNTGLKHANINKWSTVSQTCNDV